MSHAVVRVKVAEIGQFWRVFETDGKVLREKYGSRGVRAYREIGRADSVVLEFEWDPGDIARFLADPEVKTTMQRGGALGAPEFTLVEPIGELAA